MRKYRNTPVVIDGEKFDSKREAARWQELVLMVRAGEICSLSRQVRFTLQSSFSCRGASYRSISAIWDFQYHDCRIGVWVIEDVKSPITRKEPVYRIKLKLFLAKYGENYEFREVL